MPARNPGGTTPLHAEVRAEITRRIDLADYTPDEPLPSAASLADEFGVSMITIKRALKDLQSEGVLTSRPGLGTFVKRPRRFVRDYNVSLNSMDDAQRLGFTPRIDLVSLTIEAPNGTPVAGLTKSKEPMHCLRKVIFADDIPVMFDTTYFALSLGDDFLKRLNTHLIYDALKEIGVEILRTELTIDASPASAETQRYCHVPNGYPCLLRRYKYKTNQDGLEFFGFVESPFDRMSCTLTMGRE